MPMSISDYVWAVSRWNQLVLLVYLDQPHLRSQIRKTLIQLGELEIK